MRTYHVYILTNQSRTLYIGMTSDLTRRMEEHRSGGFSGFTSQYHVTQLVYYEATEDVQAAITRRYTGLPSWYVGRLSIHPFSRWCFTIRTVCTPGSR